MDIKYDIMRAIQVIKDEKDKEALERHELAYKVFAEVKDEIIAKIDRFAFEEGKVTLRKNIDLPNGPDSIDYKYLNELCKMNCIRLDWSEHMSPGFRSFTFVLDLREVEKLCDEGEQLKLELK